MTLSWKRLTATAGLALLLTAAGPALAGRRSPPWILWHRVIGGSCTPDGWCPTPSLVDVVLPAPWRQQRTYESEDACYQAWRRLEDTAHQRWHAARQRELLWSAPYDHGTHAWVCLREGVHPTSRSPIDYGPPPKVTLPLPVDEQA
jgi:hypothetical protein